MRIVAQRVRRAAVAVGGETVGEIGPGLMLLVGVTHGDSEREADFLAKKVANLRIFDDAAGVMNRSALDLLADGDPVGVLVISQFTLYGDIRKGRRPSWIAAARPEAAAPLVDRVADQLHGMGLPVATGRFGAEMIVSLENDGPVTLWFDTADWASGASGDG